MFVIRARNRTVKELRKNQGLTAKELALQAKLDPTEVLKIDNLKLRNVPASIKCRILPHIDGSTFDKIPWL